MPPSQLSYEPQAVQVVGILITLSVICCWLFSILHLEFNLQISNPYDIVTLSFFVFRIWNCNRRLSGQRSPRNEPELK